MSSLQTTRLRIDRSKPYATIHGERAPGDPHQHAQFSQDGIYYDASGFHIPELIADEKIAAMVEKRLARQMKAARNEAPSPDDEAGSDDPDTTKTASDGGGTEVNLESWLRGEAKYQWFAITKTVRERYHQNLTKLVDVLEFLVFDEKVIPEDALAPELKLQLRPQQQG